MLSRVASQLYWMTRHLERAEDTARLINVHGHLLLDLPRKRHSFGWEPLIDITGSRKLFDEHYRNANESNVVKFLISDEDNPSAIISTLAMARENLRSTRDIIPREAWEEVNDLYLSVRNRLNEGVSRRGRYDFLKYVIRRVQLVTGLLHGTMSHGESYNFMRLGCYLERADMTSRLVDVRSANLLNDDKELDLTPLDNIQWMSVLKSLTAYQMYRQHMGVQVTGADVLEFLLGNDTFPRAFNYCVIRAGFCLKGLPTHQAPLRKLYRVRRLLEATDLRRLAEAGLKTFIDELQIGLATAHDSINDVYFNTATQQTRAHRKAA